MLFGDKYRMYFTRLHKDQSLAEPAGISKDNLFLSSALVDTLIVMLWSLIQSRRFHVHTLPILTLGVSLIHVRIWHERTMCAFGHWRSIAQNFGRGRTRAEPWVLWKRPKYPKTARRSAGRLHGCNFAQCALTCKSNV